MRYRIALINPPIIHMKNDPFGNIPFMPTGILYLAGYLKKNNIDFSVIDGFGSDPARTYKVDEKLNAAGLTEDEIVDRLRDERVVGISVHSGMSHAFSLRLAGKIRKRLPQAALVAGGNHASAVYNEFIDGGFDYVCIGEGEQTLLALIRYLQDGRGRLSEIPGLAYRGGANLPNVFEEDLDKFGFAMFGALPLENYWNLGMSHAPIKGRYIAITTSRGCPYNCRFCATPALLGRKWRSRSSKHVLDEIEGAVKKYGVEDIIIQDEIFGCRKEHAQSIAEEILKRKLKIRLYLPSGIKAETLDDATIALLRKAGLEYMCLAPESGSERMLKNMNKMLDFEKFYHTASFAKSIGIRLGCFFILGFDGESREDRRKTREMIIKLARKIAVDEIILFIWTPLPGAGAFEAECGWSRYEDLNWSPSWRSNYKSLANYRRNLYIRWFAAKMAYNPLSLMRSLWNVLKGRFELKSEMALRRLLHSAGIK